MNNKNVKIILKDIPIFWINLQRSNERRIKMENNFKKYNLQATRVDAIDGDNINLKEYKENFNINEKMNKYEVACTLSHLKAIKTSYDQGLEYALILEDDVEFDYLDYKKYSLSFLLEELNKINGECIQLSIIVSRKNFLKYANSDKLLIKGELCSAVSYLITREGMKKVLDNFYNTKNINVSEHTIFKIVNNYITKPYFTYPFLKDECGTNPSFIRENNKSAHATQTINKQLWNEYYFKNN